MAIRINKADAIVAAERLIDNRAENPITRKEVVSLFAALIESKKKDSPFLAEQFVRDQRKILFPNISDETIQAAQKILETYHLDESPYKSMRDVQKRAEFPAKPPQQTKII